MSDSLVAKRRAVALFLAAMIVWPALQFGMVRTWNTNPWKLFAWGMYTQPRFLPQVSLHAHERGRVELPLTAPELERAEQLRVDFQASTEMWGRLARPDALARAVFEGRPETELLEIVVTRHYVDPDTARLTFGVETYFYDAERGRIESLP